MGKPQKVVIEGARMSVCMDCSKHGTMIWKDEPKPKFVIKPKGPRPQVVRAQTQPRKAVEPSPDATVELVENFGAKVRQAREKLGLSHEALAKKLSEKVSRLKKIEMQKMVPDNILSTKLEHALKVKLIVQTIQEKTETVPRAQKAVNRELTLGDLVKIDNADEKEKGDTAGRKRS